MFYFLKRILSYLPSKEGKANLQKLADYLASNSIDFKIENIVEEDGAKYFLATAEIENGYINTSGETLDELNHNIKDAIFTAFSVPAFYCDEKILREQSEVMRLQYAAA